MFLSHPSTFCFHHALIYLLSRPQMCWPLALCATSFWTSLERQKMIRTGIELAPSLHKRIEAIKEISQVWCQRLALEDLITLLLRLREWKILRNQPIAQFNFTLTLEHSRSSLFPFKSPYLKHSNDKSTNVCRTHSRAKPVKTFEKTEGKNSLLSAFGK